MTDSFIIPSGNLYIGATQNTHANGEGLYTGDAGGSFSSYIFHGTLVEAVASNTSGGSSEVGVNTTIPAPFAYSTYSASVKDYCYPRSRTVYTTSQAWVPPTGNIGKLLLVMCWAGGGSGALRTVTSGGGGGGAFSMALLNMAVVLDYPASMYIVVGAGGAAKSVAGVGVNGGDSYFGNTSQVTWCGAGGGRGGGNTGTMCNGGVSGSPYAEDVAAGTPYGNENGFAQRTYFSNWASGCTASIGVGGAATGTGLDSNWLNEAVPGILGYGGGGGSANTSDYWNGAHVYGNGGAGGGGGAPTTLNGVVTPGGYNMFAPGFINVSIPGYNGPGPINSTNHSGMQAGNGANNTTSATAASIAGGGGGGCNTGGSQRNSGKGGDGLVIVTIL